MTEDLIEPKRVKVWMAALWSVLGLYVPWTPLILFWMEMGDLPLELLPGLPASVLVYLIADVLGRDVWDLYSLMALLTLCWAGGLFWLSFVRPSMFKGAVIASIVVSILGALGTLMMMLNC